MAIFARPCCILYLAMLILLSSTIAAILLSFSSFRFAQKLADPDPIQLFPQPTRRPSPPLNGRLFTREVAILRWFSVVCWIYAALTTLLSVIWLAFSRLLPPAFQVYTPVAIAVTFLFSFPGMSLIKNVSRLDDQRVRQRIYIATAIISWLSLFLGSFTLMSALEPEHPIMMSVEWIPQPQSMAIAALLFSLFNSIYWPFYDKKRSRRRRSSRSSSAGSSVHLDGGDG